LVWHYNGIAIDVGLVAENDIDPVNIPARKLQKLQMGSTMACGKFSCSIYNMIDTTLPEDRSKRSLMKLDDTGCSLFKHAHAKLN